MASPASYPHVTIVRIAPEILLKAPSTRKRFQAQLRKNLSQGLRKAGVDFELTMRDGRVQVHSHEEASVLDVISRTFGVASYSPVDCIVDGGLEAHKEKAVELYSDLLKDKTYAVRVKRLGKKEALSSVDMERQIGGVLNEFAKKVDLSNPEVTIKAEVTGERACFFTRKIEGPGGFPIGIQGRCVTLISGGFDSVVAAWYLMKRGAVNDFVFCNLAGSAYERMVLEVTKTLCDRWACGTKARLFCVDFEKPIEELRAKTDPQWWQVILKRQMYRAGCEITKKIGADAIVTGEALGQVSSQTLSNLNTIDAVADIPVLRPLIGFDKSQIIRDAQTIGTAAMSEKIPEFCALNKRHPAVQSERTTISEQESLMDQTILENAIESAKIYEMSRVEDADLAQHSIFIDKIPDDAIVLDCQPEDLFEEWHIPGARHVSAGHLMKNLRDLEKTTTYVLYCPFGTQSAVLAENMQKRGFEAYSYKGGIRQLKKLYA